MKSQQIITNNNLSEKQNQAKLKLMVRIIYESILIDRVKIFVSIYTENMEVKNEKVFTPQSNSYNIANNGQTPQKPSIFHRYSSPISFVLCVYIFSVLIGMIDI